MSADRQASVRRSRGAVALARARLGRQRAARLGKALAWLAAMGFGGAALLLRLGEGPDVSLSGLVVTAAHWVAWLAGAPIALAAAQDHGAADRRDGIVALAAARGVSPAGLASARALAAMMEVASGIGTPLVALALLAALLAGRLGAVIDRVGLGLGAAAFALIAGVTLGGLSAACGRFGGARARWLFVAIIVGPWVLADLAGRGAWSIPGALDAVLDFALRARGAAA